MTVIEHAPPRHDAPCEEDFDALLRGIEADLDLTLAAAASELAADDRRGLLQRFTPRAGLDDIMW
jgi:hypothetical protein